MNVDYMEIIPRLIKFSKSPPISSEELLGKFGAQSGLELAEKLFTEALEEHSDEAFTLAKLVCIRFDLFSHFKKMLIEVLSEEWHTSHEDIAWELGRMQLREAVPALLHVTKWVPSYLKFDEARALAVKAIYSLALIPGDEAVEALRQISQYDNELLAENARERLRERLGGAWGPYTISST